MLKVRNESIAASTSAVGRRKAMRRSRFSKSRQVKLKSTIAPAGRCWKASCSAVAGPIPAIDAASAPPIAARRVTASISAP